MPVTALAPESAARARPPELTLADVAKDVRAGRDAAALASLARLPETLRTSAPVHYLEGRLAERTGHLARAAGAYEEALAAGLPEHAALDARARRARALARAGRCAEARPLLLAEGSPRSRAVAGECALEEGLLDEAITLLRQVDREAPGPVDTLAVRVALAEALRRKGDVPGALALLRTTWLERPTHRDLRVVEAALRALDARALERTDAERAVQVEVLAAAGAFAEARRTLAALPAPETTDARIARERRLGELSLRARAFEEAADAYERALALSHDDRDALDRARALVRAGSHTRALPLLDALARAHPRDATGEHARYLAADIALGQGDTARALAFTRATPGARANELRVLLVLHALVQGDATLAAAHVEAVSRVSDSFRDERARYLRARVQETARDLAAAKTTYHAILADSPYGYYGLVSAVRLRALGEDVGVPALPIGDLPASAPLPDEVAFYHALGLADEARAALRRAEPALRARLGVPGLVAMHLAVGGYARAHALARTEVVAGKTALTDANRALFHAAYPRPYANEVVATASHFGVRPAHVYATMRQESAYDPDARSSVGALGLLQLMPATARRIAMDLALPPENVDPFDPHTNVRLGIGEMAGLTQRFHGQLPLMIAAYNAGTARVMRWLPAGQAMPTDLFIERIPYDETRGYVRRVLGHFAVYSALDGHPERVFEAITRDLSGH